ncbi:SsrA-binding protein SmpB [candidate division WOR-3 bacterium]|jgi:SsrA-binding protein|nr:SsrA-binding protein SmpB [candidate division WOR-3 bacterium]
MKSIVKNKKANFTYHILKTYEAGIALNGAEVKSIRLGKVSIKSSYGKIVDGEIYLFDMHISPYDKASCSIDPKRERKLLLHKGQIRRIENEIQKKGMTLIPTEVYLERELVKVKIALVIGKKKFEKKDKIIEREQKREIRKNL